MWFYHHWFCLVFTLHLHELVFLEQDIFIAHNVVFAECTTLIYCKNYGHNHWLTTYSAQVGEDVKLVYFSIQS